MMRQILFLASLPMIAAPMISMGASPATATPSHASVLIADFYHNDDNYQYRNRDYQDHYRDQYRNRDYQDHYRDDRDRNPDYYRSWYNNHYRSYQDNYTYDWYRRRYHGNRDQFYSWFYNHYNHR